MRETVSNGYSFLLEPDTEVCLPGTIECWRVTSEGGRTWHSVVSGRDLKEAR